jgi:hypothetical protein
MATARVTKEKTRSQTGAKSKAERGGGEAAQGATIPIPVPEIHTRRVSVPDKVGEAKQALTGQRRLPSGRMLTFYGALAATAVFGVIDWPVAAAIGVGTIIARRSRS